MRTLGTAVIALVLLTGHSAAFNPFLHPTQFTSPSEHQSQSTQLQYRPHEDETGMKLAHGYLFEIGETARVARECIAYLDDVAKVARSYLAVDVDHTHPPVALPPGLEKEVQDYLDCLDTATTAARGFLKYLDLVAENIQPKLGQSFAGSDLQDTETLEQLRTAEETVATAKEYLNYLKDCAMSVKTYLAEPSVLPETPKSPAGGGDYLLSLSSGGANKSTGSPYDNTASAPAFEGLSKMLQHGLNEIDASDTELTSEATIVSAGQFVGICNLVQQPELNGRIGQILGWRPDEQRWEIELKRVLEGEFPCTLGVRPENLMACPQVFAKPEDYISFRDRARKRSRNAADGLYLANPVVDEGFSRPSRGRDDLFKDLPWVVKWLSRVAFENGNIGFF